MSKTNAFSLFEMLICMAIFSIVSFFATTGISQVYERNQLYAILQDLKSAIHYAKTEALIHQKTTILTSIASKEDWSSGIILFTDNPYHRIEKGTPIFRQWLWNFSNFHISWHGFQSDDYLLFSPQLSQAAMNGYFLVQGKQRSLKLILNRLGRMRIDDDVK